MGIITIKIYHNPGVEELDYRACIFSALLDTDKQFVPTKLYQLILPPVYESPSSMSSPTLVMVSPFHFNHLVGM